MYAFALTVNTIIDDYLWIFKKFQEHNYNEFPPAVIVDYDENLIESWNVVTIKTKIISSPWSIRKLEEEVEKMKDICNCLINLVSYF